MNDNCKRCSRELTDGWMLDGQGNKICASCKASILLNICESLAFELAQTRSPYLTEQDHKAEASQIFEDYYITF